MKILVVSHVTLVMSLLVVTLGPVRVMGAGVVIVLCVDKVNTLHSTYVDTVWYRIH